MLFSSGRGLFLELSAAEKAKGAETILRCMPGSRPSSVALL